MPVWRRPFPTSELRLRQLRPGSLWPLSGLGPCSRAGPEASGPCSAPGASGLDLGLEPSARALGLGLGSWSLLPAWAWEPLLVGPTPHSCSTSPRRTGSFRATVFCRTLNKVELVMEPWTEDLKLSVARTSACSLK